MKIFLPFPFNFLGYQIQSGENLCGFFRFTQLPKTIINNLYFKKKKKSKKITNYRNHYEVWIRIRVELYYSAITWATNSDSQTQNRLIPLIQYLKLSLIRGQVRIFRVAWKKMLHPLDFQQRTQHQPWPSSSSFLF